MRGGHGREGQTGARVLPGPGASWYGRAVCASVGCLWEPPQAASHTVQPCAHGYGGSVSACSAELRSESLLDGIAWAVSVAC